MGRKKKKPVKPWCWYCNREFDDDKVLIYHQKAKHFKCHICHKKLYTAPGLAIHCSQVHKETVSKVPNAVSGRDNIDVEIFGLEGIPESDRIAHELAVQGGGRSAGEGEPSTKKLRMDGGMGMMYTQPVIPGMGPPMIMPGMTGPILPGMAPPGMPPAAIKPGIPPPGMQVPPPSRPLFPSAGPSSQAPTSMQTGAPNVPRPTFPAYQSRPGSAGGGAPPVATLPDIPVRVAAKVPPVGANSKLMHPEEDISMEEIRSRLPKYRVAKISSQPAVSMPEARMLQPPLQGGAPPLGRPQMNAPPIIRPGMGPPPPMNPNLSPMRPNIVRPGMGPPPTMAMMPPRPNFAPPQIH